MVNFRRRTGSHSSLPRSDELPECEICHGAEFYFVGTGDNKRLVHCDNPVHEGKRWARYKELSDIVSDAQLQRTLDDIQVFDKGATSNVEALNAARRFQEQPRGWFYLFGTYGNAKTEIALALFNNLRTRHKRYGIFLKLQTLVTFVYEAYEEMQSREMSSMGKAGRIGLLKRVPVLVIDEFDFDATKLNITSNVLQILFEILDARYEHAIYNQQVTIFTSNQPPSHLPPALRDRVLDGRFIVSANTAPSKRPIMTW